MTGFRSAILYVIPLLLGVVCHEVAHGWAAEKFGDSTGRDEGRITFNPLVHIDPFGTVIVPLVLLFFNSPFLFGWAKPMPVQLANLRGGRRAMAVTALAGPAANLLLACASAIVYRLLYAGFAGDWIANDGLIGWVANPLLFMAEISINFNLVLMIFNLLPIPPLDGGHAAMGLLPEAVAARLERLEKYGMLIVLVLIGSGVWAYVVHPVFSILRRLLGGLPPM